MCIPATLAIPYDMLKAILKTTSEDAKRTDCLDKENGDG